MQSKVALLSAVETITIQDREVQLRADQVLVRVHECGICGSDMKMYGGHHPIFKPTLLLGHEFFGEVVEGTDDQSDSLRRGDLVTVVPRTGCGHCYNCKRGLTSLCPEMKLIGGDIPGGLSELVAVPRSNVIPIPPTVPPELRVLIEPLSVAVHVVSRANLEPGLTCLIIGSGVIGILTAYVLRERGMTDIFLADISSERLDLASDLGFVNHVNTSVEPLLEYVRTSVRPEGVDIAFECVGSSALASTALDATCKGGRVILAGIQPENMTIDGVTLQRGERSLVGVQMYRESDFIESMDILSQGIVSPKLVSHHFPLDHAAEAFDTVRKQTGAFKVVVDLN